MLFQINHSANKLTVSFQVLTHPTPGKNWQKQKIQRKQKFESFQGKVTSMTFNGTF